MLKQKIIRAIAASDFKDFAKKLITIQNEWKGEIISISKQNSDGYEIVFQTCKPKNIPCRIPAVDNYGWCIPERFRKETWKNDQDAIDAIKYNIVRHYDEKAGEKVWKKISDEQLIHILWYMKKDYACGCKDDYRSAAHTALIYARDSNNKQIIAY